MKKRIMSLFLAVLMIVSGLSALYSTAYAAATQKIEFKWQDNGANYDTNNKDKNVSFTYYIFFKGKDNTGTVKENLSLEKKYEGKFGQNSTVEIPVQSMKDVHNNTYTDCTIESVRFPVIKNNYRYSVKFAKANNNDITVTFYQNMSTKIDTKVAN